ncbi:MAG: XdhC family protein [Fidelibacterota bacterium]
MEKRFYQTLVDYDFTEPCALCAVMEWKGSVPRKDYPMMLVMQSGKIIGTIGGGRMEKSVIDLALMALEKGRTMLESYDFTNDDLSDDGGLCGGTLKVAIEPYTREIQSFWADLQSTPAGQSWLTTYELGTNRITRRQITGRDQIHDNRLDTIISGGKSRTVRTDEALILYRHVAPESILHIFGGGHVGKAVADLAHFIDLDITIHDDREYFVRQERFPHALSRSAESITALLANHSFQSSDLALVVTRGHRHDLALIRWLLQSEAGWIGLVSSRRKWKLLSQGLLDEGFTKADVARIEAPVGMDIQAETVPEIAVSIVGRIIQYLRTI